MEEEHIDVAKALVSAGGDYRPGIAWAIARGDKELAQRFKDLVNAQAKEEVDLAALVACHLCLPGPG